MATSKLILTANASQAIKEISNVRKELEEAAGSAKKVNASTFINTGDFENLKKLLDNESRAFEVFNGKVQGSSKSFKLWSNAVQEAYKSGKFTDEELANLTGTMQMYGKEVEKSSSKTKTWGQKMLEIGKNIVGFQLAIAVFRKTITAITTFFKDSAKAAAEAEQVFSKLSTVYTGFSKSASQASQELASSIGVATSTASSALSTIGDLLQAQGMSVGKSLETATKWAEQFQDIIAFKDINMSLEEFADSFMSGAAGNLRNFRTFGSIVKESAVQARLASKGLDKLTGSELELAKMTTRAEMALEQQSNALGATEREWETMLSVNRRYTESMKELKENVGESINEGLKPLKKWITEIVDSWNDAYEAKKRYFEEDFDIDQEFDTTNGKDTRTLRRLISISLEDSAVGIPTEKLAKLALATGASAETVVSEFMAYATANSLVLEEGIDRLQLIADVAKHIDNIVADINAEEALEKRRSDAAEALDSYTSTLEAIRAVSGAGNVGFDISGDASTMTERALQYLEQELEKAGEYTTKALIQAGNNIFNAVADDMGLAMEYALGTLTDTDLLEAQIEATKSMFEIAWNDAVKAGVNPNEDEAVVKLIENFEKLNAELETVTKNEKLKAEAQEGIEKAYNNLIESIYDEAFKNSFMESGYNEEQAKIALEYQKNIDSINKYFEDLKETTYKLNGEEITQAELLGLLNEEFLKNLENAKTQNEENNPYLVLLGQFEGLYTALTTDNGDWISAVISIAQNMETFEPIFNAAQELIDLVDSFLAPLGIVLRGILDGVLVLVHGLLAPLFEPLKMFMKLTAGILGVIETIVAGVYDVAIGIYNTLVGWLVGKVDYIKIEDIWSNIAQMIADIDACTFDIKKNTDDSSSDILKAYYEMYQKGFLNLEEYRGLANNLAGVNYDAINASAIGAWSKGSYGSTVVYTGAITITIDGTGLNADEIANKVARVFEEQGRSGANTYSYAY